MMMSRVPRYILFILILAGMNFIYIASAQENSTGELINRPKLEYKSTQLRDPFQSYLTQGLNVLSAQEGTDPTKIDPNVFIVQGIIWGGRMPQAIINNKVVAVGDIIDGAKISKIDKNGITLSVSGGVINLLTPGFEKTSKKDNEYVVTSELPINMRMSSTNPI